MKKPKQGHDVIRYTSVGIQMVLIIGIMAYAGDYLDGNTQNEQPIWTAILALFGVVVSVVYMITAFNKISKK